VSAALIWVIEDNDQNFELVEFLLDEAGHRVARARDASELPILTAGEPPALVLLDMNLPTGSGLELVTGLRALPGLGGAPIIALTAHAMRGDRERFLAAGCDDYISKPIEANAFLEAVRRALACGHQPGEAGGL
jgi:two-component system, cell cycle response regulator DivK